MSIKLTEDQRKAVMMGQTVRLSLPEFGDDVLLLRAEQASDKSATAAPRRFTGMLGAFLSGFGSVLDMFTPPQAIRTEETDGEKLQGDWDRIAADMRRAATNLQLPQSAGAESTY